MTTNENYVQEFLPHIHSEINCNSKYYGIEEMCNAYHDYQDNLSIMYANCRSLPKHIGEYHSLLDCLYDTKKVQFDILCFVETWLNEQNSLLANFDQYNHIMIPKVNTNRGGVISIFIKDGIVYEMT